MGTERDVTRIVQSWLRTDENESADRVLDDVLALLDTTPQRRSWWPARRVADMNSYTKLAIAAAAVVVVGIVGISLLPAKGGTSGGPTVSPSPSPSPSIAPSLSTQPSPSPTIAAHPPTGTLAIGRHSLTREGKTFTLELTTTGWYSNGEFGIDKGNMPAPDSAGFIIWTGTPDGAYKDPCGHVQAPPVARTTAALATAISKVPGIQLISGPTKVTIGGRPAHHVVIKVPENAPCSGGDKGFYLWYDQGVGGRWATALGSTIHTWIIDVDGALIWIDGETYKDSSPAMGLEVEQIVNSIQFVE